ncbi:hypothetical protein PsorP6_004431 [Peronosclerospora sorghi]|uniref:Uncharacterized protein n=1 Tax=Peronosclerospora sorghi TaxID=230839 RepID=A0ACC0VJT2_9STRA|nr:hypothetical protein PsorP6_004431 [Peronosclerospora sorghi]
MGQADPVGHGFGSFWVGPWVSISDPMGRLGSQCCDPKLSGSGRGSAFPTQRDGSGHNVATQKFLGRVVSISDPMGRLGSQCCDPKISGSDRGSAFPTQWDGMLRPKTFQVGPRVKASDP